MKKQLHSIETSQDMVKLALQALEERKGEDIRILNISEVSVLADYFIIASANNNLHLKALRDIAEEKLERAGFELKNVEGDENTPWILMDFGDIVIHLFDHDCRMFYDLERIWRDGRVVSSDEF